MCGLSYGMLVSTAGALFLVSAFEGTGMRAHPLGCGGYVTMAALVLVGTFTATRRHRADIAGAEARRPAGRAHLHA